MRAMRAVGVLYPTLVAAGGCALTSALRNARSNWVKHTVLPLRGQRRPFIQTNNPRQGYGGLNSNTLRLLFLW
jgi:hypothetical protein